MRPEVLITEEMISTAQSRSHLLEVKRTKTSRHDTLYGALGEYCFAEWFFGEWKKYSQINTKGEIDFLDAIEVKTSAFPFSDSLNLLVREDYALKRKPKYYVQTIIDLPTPRATLVTPGLKCILAGYATPNEVDSAPLKDFGSKFGGEGGYKCRYIPISKLKSVYELKLLLQQ